MEKLTITENVQRFFFLKQKRLNGKEKNDFKRNASIRKW